MMETTRPGRLIFVVAEQHVFVLIAHRGLPGWTGLAGTGEGSGLRAPSRVSTRRMSAAAVCAGMKGVLCLAGACQARRAARLSASRSAWRCRSLVRAFIRSRVMIGCMAVSLTVIRNGSPRGSGRDRAGQAEIADGVVVALPGAGEGEAWICRGWLVAWPL
jgi:hypothetical protein